MTTIELDQAACPSWCASYSLVGEDAHVEHRSVHVAYSEPDHFVQMLRLGDEAEELFIRAGGGMLDVEVASPGDVIQLAMALLELAEQGQPRGAVPEVTQDERYTTPSGLSWTIHPKNER